MASNKKKTSVKKRRKLKVVIFVVEIIILLIVLAVLYAALQLSKLDSGNKIPEEELEFNELTPEVKENIQNNYISFVAFGLDNRSNGNFAQGNSDVIILVTVNKETKEVRMVSVYRDTYLNLTGDSGYRKANAAFANGGVKQAINMLNTNLDMQLEDYVVVDFNAVAEAVDLLGGVEIEITNTEAKDMWGYMDEVGELTGKKVNYLYSGGTYNLDGVQAVSYARLRTTAGDDFKRTERQRLVIQKMVEKALQSDLATINSVINKIFPEIETSYTSGELISLAADAFSYSLGESTGFPMDRTATQLGGKAGDCVIALDLANNVRQLHSFLYGGEDYEVSDRVQEISDEIVERTGLSLDDLK